MKQGNSRVFGNHLYIADLHYWVSLDSTPLHCMCKTMQNEGERTPAKPSLNKGIRWTSVNELYFFLGLEMLQPRREKPGC